MKLTKDILESSGVHYSVADGVLSALLLYMDKFGVNTPLRLANYLAQMNHESNGFRIRVENLNYSEQALLSVFGKYFTDMPGTGKALAKSYARKPEAIANLVYANRMGNGPTESGEGWLFRGRGPIMLTGKSNYARYSKVAGFDFVKEPDKLAELNPGVKCSLWYWQTNGLNELADLDKGVLPTAMMHSSQIKELPIIQITKSINGGLNGLQDRIRYLTLSKKALDL